MKALALVLAASMMASVGFAADQKHEDKTTTDTSKITGTTTTEHTVEDKGHGHDMKMKHTVKKDKHGKVKETVKAEGEAPAAGETH